MTAPPLHSLVVAMARMMCASCSDCHGRGRTMNLRADNIIEATPCPTCGDVRKALADTEGEK